MKRFVRSVRLNSAATIVFSERDDSDDPKLVEQIDEAEAIFIAGGDQSNYVRFWQDTPVEDALNRHIAAGKPIGGSSAGLAILGEFSFSSMIDTIHSPDALADPYGNKVTISRDFLRIPLLSGVITDTHFVKRDRMGRLRRVPGAYSAGRLGQTGTRDRGRARRCGSSRIWTARRRSSARGRRIFSKQRIRLKSVGGRSLELPRNLRASRAVWRFVQA